MPTFARRFAYNAWANREALRSLRSAAEAGAVPDRAPALLAHMVAAERLWLGRLLPLAADSGLIVWPTFTLDESEAQLADLARIWPAVLDGLDPDRLEHPVHYVNTRGEAHTSPAGDILEQVLLHAHYHRGQIASLLGRAGLTPATTDFIHWARTVEPAPE